MGAISWLINGGYPKGTTRFFRGWKLTMVISHLRKSWDDPPSIPPKTMGWAPKKNMSYLFKWIPSLSRFLKGCSFTKPHTIPETHSQVGPWKSELVWGNTPTLQDSLVTSFFFSIANMNFCGSKDSKHVIHYNWKSRGLQQSAGYILWWTNLALNITDFPSYIIHINIYTPSCCMFQPAMFVHQSVVWTTSPQPGWHRQRKKKHAIYWLSNKPLKPSTMTTAFKSLETQIPFRNHTPPKTNMSPKKGLFQ